MSRGVLLLAFSVLPPITVPEVTLPPVTLPPVTLPEVTIPEVTLPEVTLPEVTIPPITVPDVTLPGVTVPTLPTTTTVATTRTNGDRTPSEPEADAVTSKSVTGVVDPNGATSAGEAPTVQAEPVVSPASGDSAGSVGGPTTGPRTSTGRGQGAPAPTVQGRSFSVPATLPTGDTPNSGNRLAEALAAFLLLGVGLATVREGRSRTAGFWRDKRSETDRPSLQIP